MSGREVLVAVLAAGIVYSVFSVVAWQGWMHGTLGPKNGSSMWWSPMRPDPAATRAEAAAVAAVMKELEQ